MNMFENLSLKAKLGLGFAVPIAMFLVITLISSQSLSHLLISQKSVNHTHEVIEHIDSISASIDHMVNGVNGYMLTGRDSFLSPYEKGKEQFKERISETKALVSDTPKQVTLLNKVEQLERQWLNDYVDGAISLRDEVTRGNNQLSDISDYATNTSNSQLLAQMRDLLQEFSAEELTLIASQGSEQQAIAEKTTLITYLGSGLAILFAALAGFFITRNLTRIIGGEPAYAIAAVNRIANNELQEDVHVSDGDHTSLLAAMKTMRENLLQRAEQDGANFNEASRIKSALDVCDTNVMMADPDFNIIYMNKAVTQMMIDAETELKKDLPNIDVRNLLGQNIDVFHKNPSHQRSMVGGLKETYRTNIHVGGRTFGLIATPIFGANNDRIGTVVEWDDKTERLAKEAEMARIAADNARVKVALDNVSANVMMADADRNIIYANDAVIKTLRTAQEDIRKDLPNFNVDTMMGGNIDQFHKNPQHQMNILDGLNATTEAKIVVGGRHMHLIVSPVKDAEGNRLGTVVEWADRTAEVRIQEEMDNIIAAANDGDLSERINLADKEGFFKNLSMGLNTLLDKTSSFVHDMSSMFESMSEGDLTNTITNDYRGEFENIKTNANNTVTKLNEVLLKIQNAASMVRSSANEVAQGSDDLSRRTESQASSLEETASSMEEMTSTVKQTTENASEANTLAGEAKSKAQAGGEVVEDAVNAMSEILDSSNKINDIIGVIDEIAFQTNLLALNAAVEAARAGEQGRGFAVVAGEVRTLSQRSAAAAKEIKDLIRDSVSKVESGSTLVNQSGETLAEIVSAVDKVATMINDVNNAAIEQNAGISQINQAITQMDEMTQQNAALVEETSAASRSMSEEANNMASMISFFNLAGGGSMAATTMATPSHRPSAAPEPVMTYKPASQASSSGNSSAASFSADDDWEDF
jgi:methyl-accepting chemotaxis protein